MRLSATDASGKTDEYICGYRDWEKTRMVSNPPDERSDTHNRFSGHTTPFYADAAYGWNNDGCTTRSFKRLNSDSTIRLAAAI